MVVLWMSALYRRRYSRAAYEVFKSLSGLALHSGQSKIFPGLPEYFNAEGRGRYAYLTGSASWLLLVVVTQMFGVRGTYGDLCLQPQLEPEQFNDRHEASIETRFAGLTLQINYLNSERRSAEHYAVSRVYCNDRPLICQINDSGGAVIRREDLKALGASTLRFRVELN